MIQPEDIRRKAELLYREFVQAWLTGNHEFFPKDIRGRKTPHSNDVAAASQAVRSLRAGSKEVVGFGYSVEWREVRSRTFGRNQFPSRIFFESADDFLRFLDRKTEFDSLAKAAASLRGQFPALEPWIRANSQLIAEIAPHLDGMREVVNWILAHPRPDIYARELPLSVDTKFIENHECVIRAWLDLILPPHTIRSDEEHFERRFGLRYAQPHLLVRFLDPQLQTQIGFPCDELSLPLHAFNQLAIPVRRVFIVENKINLLTLPRFDGGLGLGGLGSGVTILRYVRWLATAPIWYWGDIDVDGFVILSAVRSLFPQVESFLMDRSTFERHTRLVVHGTGRILDVPPHLDDAERSLFLHCRDKNLRLEQERIPQTDVVATLGLRGSHK